MLTVINTRTDRKVGCAHVPRYACDFALTPDGSHVYILVRAKALQYVSILRAAARISKVRTIPIDAEDGAIVMAPDGRAAYVARTDFATGGYGQVIPISTATNKPSTPITLGAYYARTKSLFRPTAPPPS